MREACRYNATAAIGVTLVGTAAVGTIVASWAGLGGRFALQASVVGAAFMAGVVGAAGHLHPFRRFGAANYLTTVRVGLMALMAGLVGEPGSAPLLWLAVGAVVLAAVLDGADGWLARRSGMASAFGARFDMETDAALIGVLSILVWQHEKAGAWVLMCGLMRYAFVAAGWLFPWLARPLRPTRRGKTVAIAQYIGLSAALAPAVPARLSALVAAAAFWALTWSFALDVMWLRRRDADAQALSP